MRNKQKNNYLGLALLLIVFLIAPVFFHAYRISPRYKRVTDISGHFQRFGEPRQVTRLQRGGTNFYELSGNASSLWMTLALASSAPVYVYDAGGKLVDWCSDPGDEPSYFQSWPRTNSEPVDLNHFRKQYGL
jgi:hypothetical protein